MLRLWSKVRGEDMSWEQAKQVNKYLLSRRRNMLMEVEGFLRDICISIALWLQGSLVRDTGLYRNLFGNFGSHRSLFLSKVSVPHFRLMNAPNAWIPVDIIECIAGSPLL